MADVGELICTRAQDPTSLVEALAARDNFISAVSHELRNTVAPLLLLAEQFEAMGASMSSEQLATKIALLTRNLHKFVATVDRVTEVAQLRDGNLALEPTDVDLAEVVAIVVGQQQRLASAGGVEIVVRAPPTLRGRWDRGRLAQIVTNLITNAIRFGCGGEAEIEVIDRGSNAELVVRDHGPGLAPHELKGIFDRFDHRRSRAAGGFGVGLFIVKTLAEAMGGLAIAANASGGGARFSVVLPRGSTRG